MTESHIADRARRKRAVTKRAASHPATDEVAQRAYEIFLARNNAHGHDVEDWLQAEREIADRKARYKARR